jgi:phosphocarrier protein
MNAWGPELLVGHIVIADRDVRGDARRRNILEMSAMEEVEVSFTDERELEAHLSNLEASGNVLVMFTSLDRATAAVEAGAPVDELNIGHLPATSGASAMHPAVYLGPDDMKQLGELARAGVHIYVQPLPHDPALSPVGIPRPVAVRRPRRSSSASPTSTPGTASAQVEVVNERGLHLRAAHVLAHFVGQYAGEVRVGRPGQLVNAKSLLGITTLGASRGTQLVVEVEGPDRDAFLEKVEALFASGFDEGTTP